MSDKIAYFGRDIEDAIKAELIKEEDIPEKVRGELGTKNGEIIDVFVKDLIEWSNGNGKIGFSREKYELMQELKEFNYAQIYGHRRLKQYKTHAELILEILFDHLLKLMDEFGQDYGRYLKSEIPLDRRFGDYLRGLDDFYGAREPFNHQQIALDYIAGMTDQYSLKAAKEVIFPEPIKFDHLEG